MPTWEQHQRALGKAREAGDAEAVAEIEANIAAVGQEAAAAAPEAPKTSTAQYRTALEKAIGARDLAAAQEISNEWTESNEAAGKFSPRGLDDRKLRRSVTDARNRGDAVDLVLLGAEANRRGLKDDFVGDTLADIGEGFDSFYSGLLNLPGAVASGVDNVGKGAERIVKGEVSPEEAARAFGGSAEAIVRNIPGADFVAAGGSALAGKGFNPDEQRARAAELAGEFPLSAAAGEIAGAGAIAARVAQVPGLAVVNAGGKGNIARVAAQGALTEGATGLVDTADPVQATQRAIAGGVVAPVVGATVKKLLDVGAPTARTITGAASPAGFDKLSAMVKVPARELRASFDELKAARGGQSPSIAEVVDSATRARLKPVVESQPVVGKAATEAAELGESLRPQRLKQAVEAGGPTGSVTEIDAAQKRLFDQTMQTHGGRAVDFNNATFLNKRAVRDAINTLAANSEPGLQSSLRAFQASIENGSRASIRLRDVENIRVALADAIKNNPSLKEGLGGVRDRLNRIAGNQIPEYGAALQQYGVLGDFSTGASAGKKAVSGSTGEFKAANAAARPAERKGQELGFRTALAEDVGGSYGRSTRAAEQLQDPAMLDRAHTALPAGEADNIHRVGKAEGKAGRNLEELDPSPGPKAITGADDLRLAGDIAALGKGAGAGFIANTVNNLFKRFRQYGMSERAAKGLAEGLFDPARGDAALATLEKLGKANDARAIIASQFAVTQQGAQGNE